MTVSIGLGRVTQNGPMDNSAAVYRRDRQALSTARLCLAGQLATADTCFPGLILMFSAGSGH